MATKPIIKGATHIHDNEKPGKVDHGYGENQ